MTRTIYTIEDERGLCYQTSDAEKAERLSRAGLAVKAVTQP